MATYLNAGYAPAYGNRCEAWIEVQMLGHAGVYADPLDALAQASDAVRTGDPNAVPAGVAVVFGPAPSNEGLGHSGIALGGGQMKSVWSDGEIEVESIAQFAADNAAPVIGYHNFGRGIPSGPSPSAPASAASGPFAGLATLPSWAKWLGAAFAVAIVADTLD